MSKTYSAQEIINKIQNGWNSYEDLKKMYEFVEIAEMTDEELEKLRDSGCLDVLSHAYEFSDGE